MRIACVRVTPPPPRRHRRADRAAAAADPGARRRHGHRDPAGPARTRPATAASASPTGPATCRATTTCSASPRPEIIARHPPRVPRGRRRPARDQHLQRHGDLAGRLRHVRPGLRAERGLAPGSPARVRRDDRAHPGQAALRRRRDRPDQPDGVDLARRQRPRRPQRHLRRAGRGLPGAGRRPGRRRRGRAADRDDLRHAERQGGDLRARDAVRGARPPLAGDDLRDDHRRLRPHPVRPGRPRRSGTRCGTCEPLLVGLNCALGAAEMRPYIAELSRIADTFVVLLPERRPAQRLRRVRRGARRDRRGRCGSSPRAGFVNLVGGCCGTTPAHIAAIAGVVEGTAPADAGRRSARRCGCPASSR